MADRRFVLSVIACWLAIAAFVVWRTSAPPRVEPEYDHAELMRLSELVVDRDLQRWGDELAIATISSLARRR